MPGITTCFAQGTLSARPAASSSNNGYQYFASDTGGGTLYQSNGSSWAQIGMALNGPMTAKGDLIAGGASGAATRLGAGTDAQVLTADSTQTLGIKWAATGAATLTTASAILGGDVTMTSSATWYDGPSVSLAAGTWLVVAQMAFSNPASDNSVATRLYDGTNTYALAGMTQKASWDGTLPLCAIVTPGSTITLKVQGYSTVAAAAIMRAQVTVAVGNKATQINAIKVA